MNLPSTWVLPTSVLLATILLAVLFWLKLSRFLRSSPPSGVQRSSEDHFDVSVPAVADAVRAVLARSSAYRETMEIDKATLFKTKVKPRNRFLGWLLLSTDMTVKLGPIGLAGTQVVVSTTSQWYITGDIFNVYERYIQDFLRDLRHQVQMLRQRDSTTY